MKKIRILVTGASGQSGSLIVKAVAASQHPVRALVRDTKRADALLNLDGVEVSHGNMQVKEMLRPSLEGIETVMMISSANDRMVETQCAFIDACKEAGIRHVIKFSGEESQQGFNPSRFRYTREHEQIEDYLEGSGLEWTHLRPSQFMQVYLRESSAMQRTGELRLPLEQIKMSPVDLRDVAKIAAVLLTERGHAGQSLRVTGPEALSMSDIAQILTDVTGNAIRYVPIDWAERRSSLVTAGLPAYFIDALEQQAAERVRYPEAIIDTHVHQLFGLDPTSFRQFAIQHSGFFMHS